MAPWIDAAEQFRGTESFAGRWVGIRAIERFRYVRRLYLRFVGELICLLCIRLVTAYN